MWYDSAPVSLRLATVSPGLNCRGFPVWGESIFAGGAVLGDGARRRNMVGGDGIAQQRQHPLLVEILQGRVRVRHVVEIGRFLDVRGGIVPLVGPAARNRQA